jgi:hypothetical protein
LRQQKGPLEFHELIVELVVAEEIESRSRIVGRVEPLGGVDELLDRVLQ